MLVAAALLAPAPLHAANLTDKELSDETNTADWAAFGRTHSEQRFSPLKDVNVENVSKLKPEWYVDLPDKSDMVGTPLVIDGVLYYTGAMNVVRAYDARNGKLLWEYDPKVADVIRAANQRKVFWKHSRGITAYGNKIFLATWDGRVIGIDRTTGKEVWSARQFEQSEPLNATGAPKAFDGKVFVGNGGTELGPTRGYVTAYDAETGKQLWRFYIVPGNPAKGFEDEAQEMAAKTWGGNWWEHGGGGNAWHGITFDKDFGQVIFGTGNGMERQDPQPWRRRQPLLEFCRGVGCQHWKIQVAPPDSARRNLGLHFLHGHHSCRSEDRR